MSEENVNQSWFIFDLYTEKGAKITVKECEPEKLNEHLSALMENISEFLKTHEHCTLRPPEAPKAEQPKQEAKKPASKEPINIPAGLEGKETIGVETVSYVINEKQHEFVRVKGGKYKKFGLSAWPETWPEDVKDDIRGWEVGKEYAPPASMALAFTDKEEGAEGFAKKVLAFG